MLNRTLFVESIRRQRIVIVTALLVFTCILCTHCQVASSLPPESNADYRYQGEFLGKEDLAGSIIGVQVIAMGGGRFTGVFLAGGLPGQGWDGMSRTEQSGTLGVDSQVAFAAASSSSGYLAVLSADGDTLSGKTPDGKPFRLTKVIRTSPTLGYRPSHADTVILFDGKDLKAFAPNSAALADSLLLPQGSASSGAVTTQTFGDFTLHLEFMVPFDPFALGQSRGNSGIYLQGRYELQILDSFGLKVDRNQDPGKAAQECGAFYGLAGPSLNMSYPPLSWQTYDIGFTAAKFGVDGKTRLANAFVTVRLNGVVVQDHQELKSATLLGDSVKATDGPLRFQAHGDSVLFRNIWIVPGQGTALRPGLRHGRTGIGRQAFPTAGRSGWASLTGRRLSGYLAQGISVARHRPAGPE